MHGFISGQRHCASHRPWKMRHLEVQLSWIQDRVRHGDFKVIKVPGSTNPADLFTKFLADDRIVMLTELWGQTFEQGRAQSAPSMNS